MSISTVRRRGVTGWLGLALAMVLVVAGCTGSNSPGPAAPADLVWAVPQIELKAASGIVGRWNGLRPDAPVRVEPLPESADDQHQLLSTELNAKLPRFDILTTDVVWTGEFAANGWLADLEDKRKNITKESLGAPLQSAIWNDKLWAAPFTSGAGFLYYRKDLVGGTAPTTWDELIRSVDTYRQSGGTIDAFVGQGAQYEGLVVNFLEFLWGAGGDLSGTGKGGTTIELSSAPAVRALQFMRDEAGRDGVFAPNFETMRENDALTAFADGNALFMRNWPYAFDELRKRPALIGNVGIARLPALAGTNASTAIGGSNLGVNRFSERVAAAKEFVEFASTDLEVQVGLGKLSRPPTLASAYQDPALVAKPDMKLLGEILPTAHARPPTPEWSAISREIQQQVFPAYTGRRDVNEAVESIRSYLRLMAADS